jgi:hypothetical protein
MATPPSTPAQVAALNDFKALVLADHAQTNDEKKIDPSEEQDWFSLSLGYFLGKGLPVDEAHSLSLYVRYDQHYWC